MAIMSTPLADVTTNCIYICAPTTTDNSSGQVIYSRVQVDNTSAFNYPSETVEYRFLGYVDSFCNNGLQAAVTCRLVKPQLMTTLQVSGLNIVFDELGSLD